MHQSGPESLPAPSSVTALKWLSRLPLDYIHNEGWAEINKRQHGMAVAHRVRANMLFPDNPEARQAYLDGVTSALLGLVHFSDVEHLSHLFSLSDETPASQVLPPPNRSAAETEVPQDNQAA